eukprot:gene3841-biopygen8964
MIAGTRNWGSEDPAQLPVPSGHNHTTSVMYEQGRETESTGKMPLPYASHTASARRSSLPFRSCGATPSVRV